MRIEIIAVGRLKSGPERQLYEKYATRAEAAGATAHIGPIENMELNESKAQNVQERLKQEGNRILEKIKPDTFVVLWDEKGKNLSSRHFSKKIVELRDDGISGICFIIGGPDGISQEVKQKASLTLSFGLMTLPHGIARILLAEQLYRSIAIANGHPYHRD